MLHYLCPAIRAILLDGLRPHMSSFFVGRFKTTIWNAVEATTQLGMYSCENLVGKIWGEKVRRICLDQSSAILFPMFCSGGEYNLIIEKGSDYICPFTSLGTGVLVCLTFRVTYYFKG